jgi:Na+-translocating ferredoxin:NAD+ oxidoreductase RnfD subunit
LTATIGPRVARFFRSPKGLLLVILTALLALAVPGQGLALVAPGVAAAVGVAALIDVVILRLRKSAWEFPSGAVLTGLIVAMVMSAHEPWYVPAVTSAVAIVSKYVLRTRTANLFNPAALALVATFYVFDTGQDWWGALPDGSPAALAVLFIMGAYIANRVNKLPMVLAFLGGYCLLFTATAFVSDPGRVAEIFRTPDLQMALYFAFFILTDPPTSPVKYRDQIICGAIVAAVSYAAFEWIGAAYYLLAGVLVGNLWEAWRRYAIHRRSAPRSQHQMKRPAPAGSVRGEAAPIQRQDLAHAEFLRQQDERRVGEVHRGVPIPAHRRDS